MLSIAEKEQRKEEIEYIEQCRLQELEAKEKIKESKNKKFEEMQMLLSHAKEVKKGKELEKICERERDILAQ
jgi:hypothetical protein